MKRPFLFFFLLAAGAQQAHAFVVWPTRVELVKRAAFVFVQNDSDVEARFVLEKTGGDGWLVAGPSAIVVPPGKTARFKVGRVIDLGDEERRAAVTVGVDGGNKASVPVVVPAAHR
jgi:P pilus assembly chaperone PapD